MPAPVFADLTVMKQELGLDDTALSPEEIIARDAILQRLIESTTKRMQEKMGRVIFSGNYIHRITGNWRSDMYPAETPITAVNSLLDTGTAVPAAADDSSFGYQFDDTHVWLNTGTFSRGNNNVKLDYVGGYEADALPADIIEAAIQQNRYQWVRRENITQRSQSLGPGQTVSWERDPLIPYCLEVCESYKNVAWGG